jgi:flagellar hook assembly protein FlgD
MRFSLANAEHVRLEIFDIQGRRVRLLVDETLAQGRHEIPWDGRTDRGEAVSSGVYFVRLARNAGTEVRKISVIR